jgi:uncharacterized membrane protein YphA (DoxX/SURF4 family)
MDSARVLATTVWSASLVSICVVVGLLDPAAATVTVAVAIVTVLTADATTHRS